jgi:hypothetical protein
LEAISNTLAAKVTAVRGEAISLHPGWIVQTQTGALSAKNIILATGAEPKLPPYPHPDIIPLDAALNPQRLEKLIKPQDTVAIFGSSHSAILVLANVQRLHAQIINFYRSAHRYAIEMDDWILYDNTGLKGFAADWAKQHLDTQLPKNLKRCLISDPSFEREFAKCNKVIYAVGFDARKAPFPEGQYDPATGILAPGLFGIGIAYPKAKRDPMGNLEYEVGLWKFMDGLNQLMPLWLQEKRC